jgi:hypothetical protein
MAASALPLAEPAARSFFGHGHIFSVELPMKKIFFYHLPKAGGTSIRSALIESFESSYIAPIIENDVLGHERNRGNYHSFRGFDVYFGHYGVDIYNAVFDGHLSISNFRHPVTRIYSLYRFFRDLDVSDNDIQMRHYSAVRLAKQASFAEFVLSDDAVVTIYTANQQARQLTGSPWTPQKNIDVNGAKKRIDSLAWFYLCEKPVQSVEWLRDVFDIQSIPTLNVSPRARIPEEAEECAAAILDRNQADLALYEHAVERMESK